MRRFGAVIRYAMAALLALSAAFPARGFESPFVQSYSEIAQSELPQEARATLALIRQGGPFPYARDGVVFHNRERLLPARPRGYYREYTVPTPGRRDRGGRRIVAGRELDDDVRHSSEYYYTPDHYRSFRRIRE